MIHADLCTFFLDMAVMSEGLTRESLRRVLITLRLLSSVLKFRMQYLLAQQGELTMVANLADPGYALELSSLVPAVGAPRATLKFPLGEVSLDERDDEEVKRTFSMSGILKGQILNGICIAQYKLQRATSSSS